MSVRSIRDRLPKPMGGQGGYVLITTLAAMVVCLIVLTAMIGATLANMKVEETGRTAERLDRAAEGALNAAINQLRNDPTMAAAAPPKLKECYAWSGSTCVSGDTGFDPAKEPWQQAPKDPGDAGYDPARDPDVNPLLNNASCIPAEDLIEVDGVKTRINCFNEGLQPGTPPIPTDDGAVAVRLVGGKYEGNPGSADSVTDGAKTWGTSIPWTTITGRSASAVASEVANTDAQLIHNGANPLQIFGGVEVRDQIVGATPNGPAFDVEGVASQGGPGFFAGAGTRPNEVASCGIAEAEDSYGAVRADVRVRSIFDPARSGLFCENDELAAMSPGGLLPGSGDWNHAQVKLRRQLPLSTDCEVVDLRDGTKDRVIHLEGSYDATQTRILNGWWSSEDNPYPGNPATPCNDYTFVVRGSVWFDVYDGDLPDSDPRKHSLTFANHKSNWVFGEPIGWGGPRPKLSQFPDTCDRSAPSTASSGVDITLSSRTGWHHEAGRLVICGPILPNGTHTTAIYQRPATSLGARLLPTGDLTLGSGWSASPTPGPTDATALQQRDRKSLRIAQSMTGDNTACWDSGTCTLPQPAITAHNFGDGAPNGPWPGPGKLGSLWIDLSGDAEFANQANAWTRIQLTLKDGRTCYKKYTSGVERLPDNYALTSYNLLDPTPEGTCDEMLGGANVDRQEIYDASVQVQVALAPPKERNTAWGWFNWLCKGLKAIGDWTGWWNLGCDNRPTSVIYTLDSIAMRVGWMPLVVHPQGETRPDFLSPRNASDHCDLGNCQTFINAEGAATKNGTSNLTATSAYVSTGTDTTHPNSFGNLRFILRDPDLVDGFLPVTELNIQASVTRPSTVDANNDYVDFVFKTHTGIWCTERVNMSAMGTDNNAPVTATLTPGATNSKGEPTCRRGRNGARVSNIDTGELISFNDPVSGQIESSTQSTLDVEVYMRNTGANRTFYVDHASVTAKSDGFLRPPDPFTVTWNPMTPNSDYDPRAGDATFNVFGSVSVPNNDVRVIWKWGGANAAGPLGYPLFVAGNTRPDECSLTLADRCKPAIVASALGSWSVGSWPSNPTAKERPDPLASTGEARSPTRQVTLTVCVIDDKGTASTTDDRLTPRAQALVDVSDVDGTVPSAGAAVTVRQWRVFRSGVGVDAAAAHTAPCGLPVMPSYE